MIKLHTHRLTCECDHCATMFPADRFDAVWAAARPERGDVRKAIGRVPFGSSAPAMAFSVWIDDADHLAADWPGLPGTAGAAVQLTAPAKRGDPPVITGTADPILGTLADAVPLRRRFAELVAARCSYELGVLPIDATDLVTCPTHGTGLRALTCRHVLAAPPGAAPGREASGQQRAEVAVVYDLDGDYPDVLCLPCLERYAAGDLTVVTALCSRCLRPLVARCEVVATTWYGADASALGPLEADHDAAAR